MKKIIFTLLLLLFSKYTSASQLVFVSEDGIKLYGIGSVESTKLNGHCRMFENSKSEPDYCDEKHISAYREVIETGKVNFANKYILAFLFKNAKDQNLIEPISKDVIQITLAGSPVQANANDPARVMVAIDPKTKTVLPLLVRVKGKVTFNKNSKTVVLNGSIHGQRNNTGQFCYEVIDYFGFTRKLCR